MSKPTKYAFNRHTFQFKVAGQKSTIKASAKVINATRPVTLILKSEDVRRSIDLGGVGNTQTCSMATCAKRQNEAFPHKVEGYIDWQYRTAFVVSKLNKFGMPSECYRYEHFDSIARINDSKDGQKKLLADLEKNGPREIRLLPVKERSGHNAGQTNGKRGPRKSPRLSGASLRFAVAQLGGVDG